jgi:gluconate 5-dehydrogenase
MGVMSLFRLEGKRALLTGASRGLGREMALALAEAGADVVIVAREEAALEAAAEEIARFGHDVATVRKDISRPEDAEEMAREALERFGGFDVLVNNVGNRTLDVPTSDLSYDDWQRVIDLNLTHCFLCSRIIGAGMIERRNGKIINIASMSGIIVNRGINGRAYETAKAAVLAFTKTLAADWAPYNINVNAIAPGYFLTDVNREWFRKKPELGHAVTDQIPMGRCGEPAEIGPLAVYLASEASSYMTGSTVVIDGGFTLW